MKTKLSTQKSIKPKRRGPPKKPVELTQVRVCVTIPFPLEKAARLYALENELDFSTVVSRGIANYLEAPDFQYTNASKKSRPFLGRKHVHITLDYETQRAGLLLAAKENRGNFSAWVANAITRASHGPTILDDLPESSEAAKIPEKQGLLDKVRTFFKGL